MTAHQTRVPSESTTSGETKSEAGGDRNRPQPRPLAIGPWRFDLPAVQAALSGYSDWPMRVIARRLGAPYTLCEVMLEQFVLNLRDRNRTRHHLLVSDEEHPVGGQLMGADPEDFGPAAKRLVQAGFDVVDINFGCPVKKVLGRCRGGYHLGQPDVALEIVRRVRDAVPTEIPVTVKMRRALDETGASFEAFERILEGAFAAGVAAITVHGRTVLQRYRGPADWKFLADLKARYPDHVLIGSGDLFCAADCVRMLAETGLDGVSVARGAIGNPWIFRQVRELLDGAAQPATPGLDEQADVLLEHMALACEVYREDRATRQVRKFGIHYADLHPERDRIREAFIAVRSRRDWEQLIQIEYRGR